MILCRGGLSITWEFQTTSFPLGVVAAGSIAPIIAKVKVHAAHHEFHPPFHGPFQAHQESGKGAAKSFEDHFEMPPHSGTHPLQPLSARRKLQYDPLPIRLIPPCPRGPLPRSHSGKGGRIGRDVRRVPVQVGAGNASRAPPSPFSTESITPPTKWRALTSDATGATEMHRRVTTRAYQDDGRVGWYRSLGRWTQRPTPDLAASGA